MWPDSYMSADFDEDPAPTKTSVSKRNQKCPKCGQRRFDGANCSACGYYNADKDE